MNLNNITTTLKTGITIYQYEQWQNTGSVNLMQKESHMLSKVWLKTNIYNQDSLDKPFIQLSATFTSEFDIQEYNEWLNANQYKLYPLLLDILKISLKDNFYNYSNASNIHYERGKFPSMLTIQLFNSNVMKLTINEYPIGWEWLDKVPLEDFTWLIEIFDTMTNNTDAYDFATFDKEITNGEPPYPVIEIERKGLANFLNDDQGYESGISMYGHYIACKSLNISSEEEYMNQLTDIKLICNEL